MQKINAKIINLGQLHCPDQKHGDIKLNVFPISHNNPILSLPHPFDQWNQTIKKILKLIPIQQNATQHYITIDSKFFTTPDTLRREGVHIDGNFCADPKFQYATWGGSEDESTGTWAGIKWNHKTNKPEMSWIMPYNITIPIGDYISDNKGGIISLSSHQGCQAWKGYYEGDVKSGGNFQELEYQLKNKNKITFKPHQIYFMTSNTPHETLIIDKGIRRTFIRITLNHNYDNTQIKQKKHETITIKELI